jgi:hypothetical protein
MTLTTDDIRAWARIAGVEFPDHALAAIAERLGGMLAQLSAVPDDELRDVEPAFVLPLPGGAR